jgi:hypothetical protein
LDALGEDADFDWCSPMIIGVTGRIDNDPTDGWRFVQA